MRPARLLFAFALVAAGIACDSQFGDTPKTIVVPPPEGLDSRISDIGAPGEKKAANGAAVAVSGAVVTVVDTYDETGKGNSVGTIYIADMASSRPYSGISLYNPAFVPGNLRVGPGDALDLRGTYQENNTIPIQFAPGAFLVQLSSPTAYFRYEASVPPPVEIDINDLQRYETGRQWLNMIVTVKNVVVHRDLFPKPDSGRLSATLADELPREGDGGGTGCADPFPKAPTIVNELMPLEPLEIKKNTKLKSLTGLVTFFCNLHIAPRTPADIVQE